jgi:mono/diheme cytochrome c family protein
VLRNPHSPWVVYVPVGSLAWGRALVTTGAGKTTECSVCHGPDLMGLAAVPGIAGRSPSYMMRQLYDMKRGTRKGTWSELMQPVIANADRFYVETQAVSPMAGTNWALVRSNAKLTLASLRLSATNAAVLLRPRSRSFR